MGSDDVRLLIHTAHIPEKPAAPQLRRVRIRTRLSFQERLLRNTFVACAVLLGVLALNNVRHPWAERASAHVEQALTMTVDLDKSLGQLSFVRALMPESALVFFDLAKETEYLTPVAGVPTHTYDAAQPYLLFHAGDDEPVRAAADGTVTAVSALSDGTYGVLIDHGGGTESVTAGIAEISVKNGDSVARGDALGSGGNSIYFELRQGDAPVDPTALMGL